jgi:hypothetical protein
METWKRKHGNRETWKHGNMETWRHGVIETWRHRNMETSPWNLDVLQKNQTENGSPGDFP